MEPGPADARPDQQQADRHHHRPREAVQQPMGAGDADQPGGAEHHRQQHDSPERLWHRDDVGGVEQGQHERQYEHGPRPVPGQPHQGGRQHGQPGQGCDQLQVRAEQPPGEEVMRRHHRQDPGEL
ncbi:hypothetical protein SDC9_150165 [bioreactor metagenome]|uniref:Uncharacterized protein n=1 Tax=bioreactor metagenome TaxID=1076179 RepID=A0A645EQQ6_9ZZZZ